MENDIKTIASDGIDKTTRRINAIEFMLKVIQDRGYHLHFCLNGKTTFSGEAEKVEHDLLYSYEEDILNRLKQMLKEEETKLDTYYYLLAAENKKQRNYKSWKR